MLAVLGMGWVLSHEPTSTTPTQPPTPSQNHFPLFNSVIINIILVVFFFHPILFLCCVTHLFTSQEGSRKLGTLLYIYTFTDKHHSLAPHHHCASSTNSIAKQPQSLSLEVLRLHFLFFPPAELSSTLTLAAAHVLSITTRLKTTQPGRSRYPHRDDAAFRPYLA